MIWKSRLIHKRQCNKISTYGEHDSLQKIKLGNRCNEILLYPWSYYLLNYIFPTYVRKDRYFRGNSLYFMMRNEILILDRNVYDENYSFSGTAIISQDIIFSFLDTFSSCFIFLFFAKRNYCIFYKVTLQRVTRNSSILRKKLILYDHRSSIRNVSLLPCYVIVKTDTST